MNGCDRLAHKLVADGVAPHAALGCATKVGADWVREVGGAVELFFDLASLTKPMTALATARSGLSREATLATALPPLAGTASAETSLELLLAHRAGLLANLPLHEPLLRGQPIVVAHALRLAADARRDDARGPIPAEGFAPIYSDLGYILAGAALARHAGVRDAGEAIERLIVAPLGLSDALGTARDLEARDVGFEVRVAPTERVAWRGGEVRGRVHDENAWALTGPGGSGHAGMFGTASAVLAFACGALDALGGTGSLGGGDFAWLIRPRPGGTLRAGFDGRSEQSSSAGDRFGPGAFGHLGFTGTSLWIDPDAAVVAIMLTNRVSPSRDNLRIREARPATHDALFARAQELRTR